MVNRVTRISVLTGVLGAALAASAAPAFAQTYVGDRYGAGDGQPPLYGAPPQSARPLQGPPQYAAQPAPYAPPPTQACGACGRSQGYAQQGYAQEGYAEQGYDRGAYAQAAPRPAPATRYLTWGGKVEQRQYSSESYAYTSGGYEYPRACPVAASGERVLSCQYVPFAPPAPPPEAEAPGGDLFVDGGVGPSVIAGGGGGGGGPSNGQETIGTSANGGYFSFVGMRASGSGSGSGSGYGSGSGSGNANSSSFSSATSSSSVSANISSSITIGGGFFIHGGGGGGGGHRGGGGSSCGCSGGGSGGMSGWGSSGGGSGGMSGWSGGGRRR
ncbi:MAG TPA: hypothetical protein VMU59_11770 [Caulobacteraceae bacterium]|nr:hypothetical protein [Caulobacteraceae bacterium]